MWRMGFSGWSPEAVEFLAHPQDLAVGFQRGTDRFEEAHELWALLLERRPDGRGKPARGDRYRRSQPAVVTSTALVALPQAGQNAVAAGGEPAPFTATQEVIAGSNPVLASALPDVRPAMSLSGLRHDIQIGSPAPSVISVSARGDTAGDAEATASAVARSYLQYVGSASSPAGRVPAHLLEPATSVTGTARLLLLLAGGGLCAVSGVLTGVIAAVVSRRLTS
jgi:hypothetical protein